MIVATGTSGTLGRHLSNLVHPINIELRSDFYLRDTINTKKMLGIIHMAGIVGISDADKSISGNCSNILRIAEPTVRTFPEHKL